MSKKKPKRGKCTGCGLDRVLTKDHIVPKARGGTSSPSNIQWLCQPCNEEKGDSQCWVPPVKRKLWLNV